MTFQETESALRLPASLKHIIVFLESSGAVTDPHQVIDLCVVIAASGSGKEGQQSRETEEQKGWASNVDRGA